MKSLDHISFPETAARINAVYSEAEDALMVGMLGQQYVVRHEGIFLHGQQAPEAHASVISDYIFSNGTGLQITPWRTMYDFTGRSSLDFRKKVETPLTSYVGEIISRANSLLPMVDGVVAANITESDLAINVRALPKVYLHVELSQETPDFPAEAWMLFSSNATEFLDAGNTELLAEIFKDRLVSLLRIY